MANKFKAQALNFNVIVQEKFVENRTEHGIDITGIVDANEKTKRGVVLSVGEGCPFINVKLFGYRIPYWKRQTIALGDEISFDKHRATPITLDGVQYFIVYYSDISLLF